METKSEVASFDIWTSEHGGVFVARRYWLPGGKVIRTHWYPLPTPASAARVTRVIREALWKHWHSVHDEPDEYPGATLGNI